MKGEVAMEKMKYDIEGLGRFIIFKGKPIRTPCSVETNNLKEIELLEFYLHTNVMNYKKYPVSQSEQKQNNNQIKKKKEPVQKPVQEIKKVKKKPVTILEKLAVNENIEGLDNEKN